MNTPKSQLCSGVLTSIYVCVSVVTAQASSLHQIGWGGVSQRNSVEAVRWAFEHGADGVALDVQATADGVAIGLNDTTLDRETDGTGPIQHYTWTELEGVRHNCGDPLARLVDLLRVSKDYGGEVYLDVTDVDCAPVREAVEQSAFPVDRLKIMVFSAERGAAYAAELPAVSLVYKTYALPSEIDLPLLDSLEAQGYAAIGLPTWDGELPTPLLLRRVHGRRLEVLTFISSDPAEVQMLSDLGVDGVVVAGAATMLVPRMVQPPVSTQQIGWGGVGQRNSVEAVRWAFDHGADGVELDLQTTKDGVIVGMHDVTLESQHNRTGRVDEYDWEDLIGTLNWRGEALARLEDMLLAAQPYRGCIFLDVRNALAVDVRRAVDNVAGFDDSALRVLVFSDSQRTAYAERFPSAEIYRKDYRNASTYTQAELERIAVAGYTGIGVPVDREMLSPEFVQMASDQGLKLFTWLTSRDDEFLLQWDFGVNYVVTVASFFQVPAPKPVITSFAMNGGEFSILWSGVGELEAVGTLDGVWVTTGNTNGIGKIPISSSGHRFFRISRRQ